MNPSQNVMAPATVSTSAAVAVPRNQSLSAITPTNAQDTAIIPSQAAAVPPANQPSLSASSANGQAQGAGSAPDDLPFLRFPYPMLANVSAHQPIPRLPRQRRRKTFDFMRLPDDVILTIIKKQLNIFDRAALALVCKGLAEKVTILPSMLRICADDPEQQHDACHKFFRNTIKTWFPSHLKFCQICGKYVPRDTNYWTKVLRCECSGRAGLMARNFKAWSGSEVYHNMAYHYQIWEKDQQSRTCPRCKLQTRHF